MVFHQIISLELKIIASYFLDISTPHEYANICCQVRKQLA